MFRVLRGHVQRARSILSQLAWCASLAFHGQPEEQLLLMLPQPASFRHHHLQHRRRQRDLRRVLAHPPQLASISEPTPVHPVANPQQHPHPLNLLRTLVLVFPIVNLQLVRPVLALARRPLPPQTPKPPPTPPTPRHRSTRLTILQSRQCFRPSGSARKLIWRK